MSLYDLAARRADGSEQALADFRGKVLLIVNTASKCGFTPQYQGLQQLYLAYRDKGLVVLGFPCNQFGAQEPGSDTEIQQFCSLNYEVTFPVMAKVDVNGDEADALFRHLKAEAPGLLGSEAIKWNFTKFLIDRDGHVVDRFAPTTPPEKLTERIEKLL